MEPSIGHKLSLAALAAASLPPPPRRRRSKSRLSTKGCRPNPQRYFGGRAARKMTRRLRREEGLRP